MQKKYIIAFILIILIIGLGVFYYKTQNIPISPPELDEIKETSTGPSLEELKAKTANWEVYEDEEYGIKVKYPSDFSFSQVPIFGKSGGKLVEYDAYEIFGFGKDFGGSALEGAGGTVFISNDFSKIPTKESIADNFDKKKRDEIKTFSINEFEGAVAIKKMSEEERGQIGLRGRSRIEKALAFRVFNGQIYYVNWWLYEEYESSEPKYSDITYQNQFFPFLASFEFGN